MLSSIIYAAHRGEFIRDMFTMDYPYLVDIINRTDEEYIRKLAYKLLLARWETRDIDTHGLRWIHRNLEHYDFYKDIGIVYEEQISYVNA